MKNTSVSILRVLSLFVVSALFINSCDVTSSSDDDNGHADPVGFVIEQNNVEIVRFESNQYVWNPSGTWDDYFRDDIEGLVVSPDVILLTADNPRGMTNTVRVRWIDDHGDVFDLPDLSEDEGGEYWLDWEWGIPNTLTNECSEEARNDLDAIESGAIRPANIEQHGSDGQWGFHFRADHAGEDRIRFRLMHGFGDAAHPDFTSGWMNVTVPHDQHDLIDENGVYLHERDKCRTR